MTKSFDEIRIKVSALRESDAAFPMRSAVATFLFMVMPIDGQTHPKELERLTRILSDDFSLDESETMALIKHAREQKTDQESVSQLAAVLKAHLSQKELLLLVSHMWEMVFADGRLHETEVVLVERVAWLLDIPQEKVAEAMTVEG